MSVTEAYFAFSVEVVVASKANIFNDNLLREFDSYSQFLAPVSPE